MNQPPLPNPGSPYGSPYGSPSPYGGPSAPHNVPTSDEKNWAVGAHLSAFAQFVLPVLAFVIPIFIWLSKRDESQFIATQAKEALNFQISLWLWTIIGTVCFFTVIGIPLAFGIWLLSAILGILCPILGAIAVADGKAYRYPLTIRLIS